MKISRTPYTDFRRKGRKRRPPSGGSEVGNLLSTLRTQQGWTIFEASQAAGISNRIIAKLEKGQQDTSISNLEKYLNFFGFTLSVKPIELDLRESETKTLDEKGLPLWK